jgi:hypothetical protein
VTQNEVIPLQKILPYSYSSLRDTGSHYLCIHAIREDTNAHECSVETLLGFFQLDASKLSEVSSHNIFCISNPFKDHQIHYDTFLV